MIFVSGVMLFVLPKLQRDRELEDEEAVRDDDDERFPEIVEEEGYDSDDHQMTMEAKEPVKAQMRILSLFQVMNKLWVFVINTFS